MSSKRIVLTFAIVTLFVAAAHLTAQKSERAAGTEQRFYADDPVWRDDDMRNIAPVEMFDLSKSYEFLNETFGETVRSHGKALNVNTLGEVPDSSWFTNRLGRFDMSIDDIMRGPNTVDGPAPGPWQITGRPDGGITPKFTIRDSRGDIYLIKLDPADFPELPSSVEMISTKIFHAIGYHVPEDFLVSFNVDQLTVAPGAKIRTASGDRKAIRMEDVRTWLSRTPKTADGQIRALASRYVPGKVVGQYRYTGTRPDDPNDIFPHERRRELRGLRVFAAWLNHDDVRSINSIDTYVEHNGRKYIRHYLQDFGSNLGSGSTSAQQPRGGNEYLLEGDQIAKGLLTFGLWTRGWTKARYPKDPSLGNIEADLFEPQRWKANYPQPAFDSMDPADGFWAASIASRFTNEMIHAIVATGRLSNPNAAAYLADTIIRRRDKVVAHWITGTNPLDRFAVSSENGTASLTFDNAAIRVGVAHGDSTYRVQWLSFDNTAARAQAIGKAIDLDQARVMVPQNVWGPADETGARYAVAAIRTVQASYPNWANPIHVTLRERNGAVDVVGIDREAGQS